MHMHTHTAVDNTAGDPRDNRQALSSFVGKTQNSESMVCHLFPELPRNASGEWAGFK